MVNRNSILLVNPRCLDKRLHGDDDKVIPIGLYYIAAQLIENQFDTRILNLAEGDNDPVAVFEQAVKKFKPGTIGFSVTTPNRWNAIDCAKKAKALDPSIQIVFGGPAPTFMADTLFSVCPQIDAIVKGEGEHTFLELAKAMKTGEKASFDAINGIVFQSRNKLVITPDRPVCEDLDNLVHPSRYFVYQHLSMSRGCPGNCTFCGSPGFWGSKRVRFHSARWFADEIQALVKKGVTHFYISDDTFTMDKPRVLEFCSLIRQKKLNITWNAISRVDCMDEDLALAMRKAGCIQISFGVESGSPKIRKTLGKPISNKDITHAFMLTRKYGILPRAYLIYGSPGETKETIQESCDLIEQIQPLSVIFYMLVIFPGTHLYRRAVQKNMVPPKIWFEKLEDLPWFEIDPELSFHTVKKFGDQLRATFFENVHQYAMDIDLIDKKELYPFHADFLSRLAMTFSHGEYADDSRVKDALQTAGYLFEKSLSYGPDPRAFMGLSMLMQKQKKFDRAVQLLEQGLGWFPKNPQLHICMGICMMNMGRFKKALSHLKPFDHMESTRHYIQICNQKITESSHE